MINLASLTALIRTLRQAGGPDGPAAPVARVMPVASLTPDERSGAQSGTAAVARWSRSDASLAESANDGRVHDPAASRAARVRHSLTAPAATAATGIASNQQADESAPIALTIGGQVLQAVLRSTTGATPTPPAIVTAAPLVASSHAAPADLARMLYQALAGSGLFYEAHLARWVRGEHPSSALAREPQAAWASAEPSDVAAAPAPLPEQAAELITRQLDALDTRAVAWRGEVWPGQFAGIVFEEDRRDAREREDDPATREPAWRTRVGITLPSLGRIEATLMLRGATLDVVIETPGDGARTRLGAAHDALADALSGARVTLGHFAVAARSEG